MRDRRAGPVPSDVDYERRSAAAELSEILRRTAAYGEAVPEEAKALWREVVGEDW